MIWYRTGTWRSIIESVEVETETKYFVLPKGRKYKEKKHSGYVDYWRTWTDAWNYLLDKYTQEAESYKKRLTKSLEILETVKQMKETREGEK